MKTIGVQLPLIVRGDILHNILLGILKHLMTWVEQFLSKYQRLDEFDKIWAGIPPFPGYRPPQKRYRQITMCSRAELRSVNRVWLACFTAALRNTAADASGLSAGAPVEAKRLSAACDT